VTGRGRILVVDDQAQVRGMLRDFVEHLGCEASTAASGEEAIAAVATAQPHVVFLDLRMPGMSGLEVLAHFREHHRAVPVIVITGSMHEEIALQASAAGAFAVVGKPVDLNALRGLVAQAMTLAPPTGDRSAVLSTAADSST
jgi:CheY-like chemotaxis protein